MQSKPLVVLAPIMLCCWAVAAPATAQTNYSFPLFGQAETPAVVTDASGSCVGVLSEDETTFTLSCTHDVTGATAADIHRGLPGKAGPIIFDLGDASSPIQAIWHPSASDAVLLAAGALYVNVHSSANPSGQIRGQILPDQSLTGRRLAFFLTGDEEVPAVATDAFGACVIDVELTTEPLVPPTGADLHLRCAHTIASPTAAHIHLAPRGEDGAIVFDLGDGTSPIVADVPLDSSAEVEDLLTGQLYVNVHSSAHPDGEIRGQISGCLESATTLCLQQGRFSVNVTFNTTGSTGIAHPVRETVDSGLFWFFRPSNLELLIKVLDGCAVNGHYWVFLAGTTDVGYTVSVTDNLANEFNSYSNPNGHTAETRTDTAAFATCP